MLSASKKSLGFFWMISTLLIIVYGYRNQGKKVTLFSIHGKYCSVAFIWRSNKISNSRQVVYLLGCIELFILSVALLSVSLQPEETHLFDAKHGTGILVFLLLLFISLCFRPRVCFTFGRRQTRECKIRTSHEGVPIKSRLPAVYCNLSCLLPPYIQFVFLWFLLIN